jgi:2-oxoglutarate ferredoxin oxidoreductase subunit beta
VLTGANLANKDLIYMGVSGDGDSASIGLGQFVHCIRRGVNMVYITENNGVYGLTKGQFSATADKGSKSKAGGTNKDSPIDLVGLALMSGASFVARSFSGDKKQLVPLIMAAISHPGPAFIDIISPCVAFNNHAGSTKAYDFVRAHNEAVNRLDYVEGKPQITVDYAPGTTEDVTLHDGSVLRLAKLHPEYDPHDRTTALAYLQHRENAGELVTGLIYIDREATDLHANMNTVDAPLNRLNAKELCPGAKALAAINAGYR